MEARNPVEQLLPAAQAKDDVNWTNGDGEKEPVRPSWKVESTELANELDVTYD